MRVYEYLLTRALPGREKGMLLVASKQVENRSYNPPVFCLGTLALLDVVESKLCRITIRLTYYLGILHAILQK